jgi:CheY-like chemotaxis protein
MSSAGTARAAGPRLRVLIADDNRDIRMMMRLLLEDDSRLQIVGEAQDDIEAVEEARRLQPGGVVLDLNMPGLDGWQAADAILDGSPDIAVVMFTSAPPGRDSPDHPTILKASPNWPQRLATTLVDGAERIAVEWPAWERRSKERTAG